MSGNCRPYLVISLVGMMLVPSIASGEQARRASSPTLATIAAEHAARKQADRQTILHVLHHEEVRDVAKRAGVRIEKLASAVAVLDDEELAQVMEQARHVNDALAGGQRPWWKPSKHDFFVAVMIVIPMAVILWLLGNGYVL